MRNTYVKKSSSQTTFVLHQKSHIGGDLTLAAHVDKVIGVQPFIWEIVAFHAIPLQFSN